MLCRLQPMVATSEASTTAQTDSRISSFGTGSSLQDDRQLLDRAVSVR